MSNIHLNLQHVLDQIKSGNMKSLVDSINKSKCFLYTRDINKTVNIDFAFYLERRNLFVIKTRYVDNSTMVPKNKAKTFWYYLNISQTKSPSFDTFNPLDLENEEDRNECFVLISSSSQNIGINLLKEDNERLITENQTLKAEKDENKKFVEKYHSINKIINLPLMYEKIVEKENVDIEKINNRILEIEIDQEELKETSKKWIKLEEEKTFLKQKLETTNTVYTIDDFIRKGGKEKVKK